MVYKDLRFKSNNPYNVHFNKVAMPRMSRKERAIMEREQQDAHDALLRNQNSQTGFIDDDADSVASRTIESLR